MKAIWQAKGVTPTFLGANKKSDFSNALPYWPTTVYQQALPMLSHATSAKGFLQ